MASIDFNLKHSIWHQFITGRVGVMGYKAIGLVYLYVHPWECGMKAARGVLRADATLPIAAGAQ